MSLIDVIIVIVYLIGLIYMGYRLSKGNETQEDYFVGGRKIAVLPIALSVAATTMSANSFIGGPGWSYSLGMMAFMNQFSVPLVLAIVLTVFIPFLYNLKVTSVYEYIEMRFGGISRLLVVIGYSLTSLILVGGFLYIPSLIIQNFTGWSLALVVPIVVVIAILYTMLGGIKAVIWTDTIQMIILWGGIIAIIKLVLNGLNVGFFEAMSIAKEAGRLTALDASFDLTLENGVWGTLIGLGFMWLEYFACDQSQTQRMFASKSVNNVRKSICISSFAMNITYFIFMIVGILLFVFYGGREFNNENNIMIDFITTQIPAGLLGLIIAAIFAGAMSSVDSVLNSVTTVFTKDIYEKYFSNGKRASLKVSRIFTLIFGIAIIGVTLLAYGGTTSSILKVINVYMGYISGSILGLFILAMFTKKANDKGAAIGFVLGIIITAYTGKSGVINWAWTYLVGCISTIIIGYVFSLIIKQKQKLGFEEFTFMGQRKKLMAEGKTTDEDGGVIIPGAVDKYTYISIGFFVVQFIILLLIQI